VPGVRPVIFLETATDALPAPALPTVLLAP
jgi:hypothetical protein